MSTDYDISRIRNIGIAAHIDAGKTTTTERILYYAGKIHRIGEVDEGTAQMDWMEQERERGITITAAATSVFWNNHTINIIDTPGHVDFTIEVERSLRVLDGAIVVLCAVGGVEPQTETVWRQANKYNVPRLVFVNKMDRVGADFERAVEMLQGKLGANAWPINIPWGTENKLYGVIDVIELVGKHWLADTLGAKYEILPIPENMKDFVYEVREGLLERLAEFDEDLMSCYLNNEEVSVDLIKRSIRKGVIEHGFVPVMAGSAIRNIGIQPLLDATVDYLPAPTDIPPVKGRHPRTEQELTRKPDFDAPMSALAFKIASDPFVERLTYLRIYSGHIKVGRVYLNPRTDKKERVQKIFRMHADKRQEIDEAFAGDVVAVAGMKTVMTGDTLCDPDKPIVFEAMRFPEPVIYIAVEPRSSEDYVKMMKAIARFEDEDPTFKHREDPETGQVLLCGMGELHLEIIVDRMKREFNVATNVGKPQVSYRETITKPAHSTYTLDRIIGGKHQFAEVTVYVEPVTDGKGVFEIELDLPDDFQLPKILGDAVIRGIMASKESGPLAGYPLWNIYSRVVNVKFSEENYSDVAFEMASSQAFSQAIRGAEPILLEPIMEIEVVVPDANIGEVIGDLNSRGAEIRGIDHRTDGDIVLAFVPLSEMFGYTTTLRSLTQGKGFFTMQFSHYRRLPKHKEEKILLRMRGY